MEQKRLLLIKEMMMKMNLIVMTKKNDESANHKKVQVNTKSVPLVNDEICFSMFLPSSRVSVN